MKGAFKLAQKTYKLFNLRGVDTTTSAESVVLEGVIVKNALGLEHIATVHSFRKYLPS